VPRSIRHLIAVAVATMAVSVSVVPALAADAPVLTGTVVDANGEPFPVENGLLEMTAPDGGGIHAAQVSVGGDGSFEVEVMPWGTDANPAEVTITITGVVAESVEDAAGCTNQFAPVAEATFPVAFESGEPEPVALVADEQLIGTVCGAGGSAGPTLPPSEVDPVTPVPSEPPAVVAPATPAASHPLLVLEPVAPVVDSGVSPLLLGAIVAGAIALIVVGAWFGLRRSRA
jgi:hypothetical protein